MMDTQRLILFIVFSFSILMLWDAWQKENRPPPAPAVQQSVPQAATPGSAGVPTPTASTASPSAAPGAQGVPTDTNAAVAARDPIRVTTDVFVADIDPVGGDIVRLQLLNHKDPVETSKDFVLFTPQFHYSAQSGLIGGGLPTHKTAFTYDGSKEVKLADGQDAVAITLTAAGPEGVKTTKTLTFRRGSYLIDVTQSVANATQAPIAAHAYFQLTRDSKSPPGDSFMLNTYTGAAVYSDKDKYVKLPFSDIEKGKAPYAKEADNGWVGMVQHYFVSAVLPAPGTPREFYTRKIGNEIYSAGVIVPLHGARRRRRQGHGAGVRRPAGAGQPQGDRAGAGSGRRLRLADGDRGAAVLGAEDAPRVAGQLGRGDHPADGAHQARVLPALGRELQVDGEDEAAHAAADQAEGAVRRRPREA